jgi:hypothetical protein
LRFGLRSFFFLRLRLRTLLSLRSFRFFHGRIFYYGFHFFWHTFPSLRFGGQPRPF